MKAKVYCNRATCSYNILDIKDLIEEKNVAEIKKYLISEKKNHYKTFPLTRIVSCPLCSSKHKAFTVYGNGQMWNTRYGRVLAKFCLTGLV